APGARSHRGARALLPGSRRECAARRLRRGGGDPSGLPGVRAAAAGGGEGGLSARAGNLRPGGRGRRPDLGARRVGGRRRGSPRVGRRGDRLRTTGRGSAGEGAPMSKTLLCPCEDVTLEDVQHAIAKGYRDVESIKRYTGFGTGLCQGKSCLAAVARTLHDEGGVAAGGVLPFTPRPPLHPVELSLLPSVPVTENEPPEGGVPPSLQTGSHALRPPTPVPERAQVVIVGGGIMGLALAHNLAKLGLSDVVVLEPGYLCAGASGRNGGGGRVQWGARTRRGGGVGMQWGTATNIELARRSIDLMKQFAGEMGINVWLRQGGSLFLAKSDRVADQLRSTAELHNRHGVNTRVLSPGEG